jgi:hypothetical protein
MADRLYLSLWYPNFRLENLPAALAGVLHQFALVGAKRVSAASAYPINFTEPPTYQRIYVDPVNPRLPGDITSPDELDDLITNLNTQGIGTPSGTPDPSNSPPEINLASDASSQAIDAAVAEATEQLHDDMAYEFEMRWQLWALEDPAAEFSRLNLRSPDGHSSPPDDDFDEPSLADSDNPWKLRAHTVRILGFGPSFDIAGYEQNGHLLVDFGLDSPWVFDTPVGGDEPAPLDEQAQVHIQQNVEKLLAFTLLVEKNCGISSRLLWTESGEPLAEKLIARLQRVN